ncbi:uncharacterized protein [Nicotiana sylvestris]|uniref:uncharacterized protein n=1 Tax=Nicotiana sylvestris TaxID=4096 RepID=UPI00388C98BB
MDRMTLAFIYRSLKEILANQQKILDSQSAVAKAVDSHGKDLKDFAREHKKLRKTRASKESVKALREDVDKLKADQLPLDLLFEDPAPAAAPIAETQQLPKKKRKLSSANEAIIQLADPPEASSNQPQNVPDIQPQKILDSQAALAKAVDSHGKALKEHAREHKKLRKTWASKESVKTLREDVDKLKADQLPLDLLFEDPAPAAAPIAETQQLPKNKRKLPSANEAIIQLADPLEAFSSQPQDVPDIQPVQVQAPVTVAEQQETGNQSEVPQKILDSQAALAKAVDSHGKALKEHAREHKKLRKTWASKESVKTLREDVDKLKADQLPLDLLFEDPAPAAAPIAETQQLPKNKRKLPSANEAIIQLADPLEAFSSQPQDVPDIQPVQVQAPVTVAEQQETGNQSEVPVHTEDQGTIHVPMQTNEA